MQKNVYYHLELFRPKMEFLFIFSLNKTFWVATDQMEDTICPFKIGCSCLYGLDFQTDSLTTVL